MTQLTIHNEQELLAFGHKLAAFTPLGSVIFLYGELGAGKTTLVRGFLRGLGYLGVVKSPTYTFVESYLLAHRHVFHFDLYRLVEPEELEYIGIRDYFNEHAIVLIEWPERGRGILPEPDLSCYIRITPQGRDLLMRADSENGQQLLRQLLD